MECLKVYKQTKRLKIDAKRIRVARAEMNWTQSKLSEESSVSRSTIRAIENGSKKSVQFKTIEKIATALGKQVDCFCTQNEK
ncbi:helix-turn-helix domain-containing protein [Bacillus wiedmannii]|uniref:helix-turn-helix domain-containing protein n=1 Tax=Bacillus cereus group TaxID=86661 RepID=UPI0021D221B4|nr:helix-turn-helix transcriptional regulator [Bacillus wiedmannii]MCU5681278.1 helix-turn-helix transcriptional regulator [Bacillus wiedmannii]